jgi:SPP1 family predicted phage head-tail adaptor
MKCCDLNSGKLKEPVTFQRKTLTSDGAGGMTQAWTTLSGAPTKAYVVPVSGSERYTSDRVEATIRLRLVVRYTTALRESDRVQIRNKLHNIRFIDNIEFANKWLQVDIDGGVAV